MAYPPRWWKDQANASKIVHTVNSAAQYEQRTTYLAFTERNAGQLWLTDTYAGLPPYWDTEISETGFLATTPSAALDDQTAMRAAHRVGTVRGAGTAWPDFEAAWYSGTQVRGTIFVDSALAGVALHDVPVGDLRAAAWVTCTAIRSSCSMYAGMWFAAHTWARAQGFETAIPTFETSAPQTSQVLAFSQGLSWLRADSMPVADCVRAAATPASAMRARSSRNTARWATTTGAARWGRGGADQAGRRSRYRSRPNPSREPCCPPIPRVAPQQQFAVYMVDSAESGLSWADVASTDYLSAL